MYITCSYNKDILLKYVQTVQMQCTCNHMRSNQGICALIGYSTKIFFLKYLKSTCALHVQVIKIRNQNIYLSNLILIS